MIYNYDILFKYIVIGDSSTGKSSLIYRFVHSSYHQKNQPTLAAQFSHKIMRVNQMDVKVMIWDTAGQETFKSMVRSFYKNCIVAFVVYDATQLQTFQNVQNWLSQIDQYCHQLVRVVLIANKSDLEKKLVVPHQQGLRLAKEKGYDFYQVSAATGLNVQKMFMQPALKLAKDLQQKKIALVAEMDIGIRFSNRLQSASQKQIVHVNIKGSQPAKCNC